ncbi:hypothetical protein Q7C36_001932 [Tachysurus vachellii]|uniref:Uncharacterized protein n=1 Tax=Tachysurus vachellii TaxID=175792 RepID=A0AA88NVA8_TACVA|nr:uncharacterized protein LOC132841667 [Tachysurus vachellii]KAK2865876.1 hypothetical protein Q7C36_001932 [Tachysurus vachellii]
MRSSVFLRALLCLLLSTVPVLCGVSAITTNVMASTPEGNENVTNSESPTTASPGTVITTTAQITTTIKSTSSGAQVPKTSAATISPPTSRYGVSVALCLILFICFLILLFFCAYKWYIRNGRPSFTETRRRLAEWVRNAWVAAGLRPSSKDDEEEEEDEEKEAGKEAEEDKNQGQYAEDDGGDSDSSDYSNMEGLTVSKKTEENDGDDDMSSVELKNEKTEREKDDLTVL